MLALDPEFKARLTGSVLYVKSAPLVHRRICWRRCLSSSKRYFQPEAGCLGLTIIFEALVAAITAPTGNQIGIVGGR
jgi:hypothetical protein